MFQKNVLLKKYTSFRIGGRTKYFFSAKTKVDLLKAINAAKKIKLPIFILGAGSNLLLSGKMFNGVVVKIENSACDILNSKITVGAGLPLAKLLNISAKKGMTGLEWVVGIPGTVGGAIYGNAGSFGKSMKDIVKEVEVLDIKNLTFKKFNFKNCKFNYRESVFKKKKNLIIFSAVLRLRKGKKKQIKNKIKEYLEYKKKTQPLNFPSAGSIFKNPRGFFAGELIEKCGLKGKKIGNAKFSEKHANFIVNLGKATAEDVKKLMNLAKKSVKKKFGVVLKEEIQIF